MTFPLPRNYITGSAASRKAEGREGARLHVPHTALKARRIQLGVLVSNFLKHLVNDERVEIYICISHMDRLGLKKKTTTKQTNKKNSFTLILYRFILKYFAVG